MRIASEALSVEVAELGAEVRSLTTADGGEWLWNGDAAWWTGRSPLLFPVVGKSPGGVATVGGRTHPMPPHGFARRTRFDVVAHEAARCVLRLADTPATREAFPFAFELTVTYGVRDTVLTAEVVVENRDAAPMPVSFGFHPAFRWPLPGCEGEAHVCRLSPPPAGIRRIDADGLLRPERLASPFDGDALVVDPALFEADAIILEAWPGTAFYGVPGRPGVEISAGNMPQLGLWQKPGAPFFCVEPWHGTTARAGDPPDLAARPGASLVEPGGRIAFSMDVTIAATGR